MTLVAIGNLSRNLSFKGVRRTPSPLNRQILSAWLSKFLTEILTLIGGELEGGLLLSPFVDGFTDSMTPVSEVDPLGDVVLHAQRPPRLLPTRRQHPGEVDPPVSHA